MIIVDNNAAFKSRVESGLPIIAKTSVDMYMPASKITQIIAITCFAVIFFFIVTSMGAVQFKIDDITELR